MEPEKSNGSDEQSAKEQEEALVALIEHRGKEVEQLRNRVSYYTKQLKEAERRLEDSHFKLARLRGQDSVTSSKSPLENSVKRVKVEGRSPSPIQKDSSRDQFQSSAEPVRENSPVSGKSVGITRPLASPLQNSKFSSQSQSRSRPQLVIPSANQKISQPMKIKECNSKVPSGSSTQHSEVSSQVGNIAKPKGDKSSKVPSARESPETQARASKRKFEHKEHKELIQLIAKRSSPCKIKCESGSLVPSQHKRKLRSLILCPTHDQLFATSALDGVVNLWQVQGLGSRASLLSSTDCPSSKQRRWPEDIAWHPEGDRIFSVYTADDGDSQISILDLNKTKERMRVTFLEEKPHIKGLINNIGFMPWEEICFATGGSDHAVILWTEKEEHWKPKALHRSMHSSAVMGVAGMLQKKLILSVGADKRIIGFDLTAGRAEYKHQVDSKCMSVQPNPCDFNLFMVQTGTLERQLRLFDLRLRQTEIHSYGWKQESSDSQSAFINQAWSPDGLYISSGSVDPVIHIFDIRYNAHKPSQSIKAHQKRVFKALWHHSLPFLISISSDLNIGLHKIV